MSWNNIPNDERLRLWKNLRTELQDLSLKEQLLGVAKFCAHMPIGSRTLDYYNPGDWPTPWEILFHGDFCKSSISLLIFYTFTLIDEDNNLELRLIDDGDDVYLIPLIADQFVLNFELGAVSNYIDLIAEFEVKQIFSEEQIKPVT